jgi:DNA repair exonuclease SbcCD ATPase subunit
VSVDSAHHKQQQQQQQKHYALNHTEEAQVHLQGQEQQRQRQQQQSLQDQQEQQQQQKLQQEQQQQGHEVQQQQQQVGQHHKQQLVLDSPLPQQPYRQWPQLIQQIGSILKQQQQQQQRRQQEQPQLSSRKLSAVEDDWTVLSPAAFLFEVVVNGQLWYISQLYRGSDLIPVVDFSANETEGRRDLYDTTVFKEVGPLGDAAGSSAGMSGGSDQPRATWQTQ